MLISPAFAQAAGAAPQTDTLLTFLPMVAIFVVFYFLLIRPQQKKAKEARTMLEALEKGNEIVTAGGILGRIVKLDEQYVTVEIAPNTQMVAARGDFAATRGTTGDSGDCGTLARPLSAPPSMNRYPAWKYILIGITLAFGLLYTLPNFFPEVPAVQVSSSKASVKIDNALLGTIEDALKGAGIAYRGADLDSVGIKVRFADTDTQLKAKDVLQTKLGDTYIVALNLLSSSPRWLASVGALPMYLGLDLRGGVHFLLQVDMKGALDKAADRYTTDIRSLMREKKVIYSGVVREGSNVVLRFKDDAERTRARNEINTAFPDLAVREQEAAGGESRLVAGLKPEAQKRIQDGAVQQNITILRNRVNELGVAEPIIQQQGGDRVVVQLPGVQDTARAKDILGRTATLEIRMVNDDAGAQESARGGSVPFGNDLLTDRNGEPLLVRRQVVLTGDRINDAQSGFDQRSNEPAVHVNLDGTGARIFKEVTRENVGKRMAIVLVEKGKAEVITAPVIREEIGGGRVQISGKMNTREANDIALLMRAGALAAPMEIVEERTVGPSLGKENIDKGFNSVLYGFIVLAAFICCTTR